MDYLNKFTGGDDNNNNSSYNERDERSSGDSKQSSGGGLMDTLQSSFMGGDKQNTGSQEQTSEDSKQSGGGGFMDKIQGKFNEAAGGGKKGEKDEDLLDKGIDFIQEKFLGQGPQNNESAIEQAKDKQIASFIRSQYKSATGSDFPGQGK